VDFSSGFGWLPNVVLVGSGLGWLAGVVLLVEVWGDWLISFWLVGVVDGSRVWLRLVRFFGA
jgi:hypothetical protein